LVMEKIALIDMSSREGVITARRAIKAKENS
jgi:hypothetical protein